jgi:hypothetical protein
MLDLQPTEGLESIKPSSGLYAKPHAEQKLERAPVGEHFAGEFNSGTWGG